MSLEQDLNTELERTAELMREAIVDSLVSQNPTPLATGRLASSIEVRIAGDGFEIYAEDWWKFVEYGRQGHGKFPPVLPIQEWIRAKGIKSNNPKIKPSNLAWAIASKLRYSNIKPRPFLQNGIDATMDKQMDKLILKIEEATDKAFE